MNKTATWVGPILSILFIHVKKSPCRMTVLRHRE